MYILPLVFLCNTLIFVVLLEERFKLITTASIALVSFLLSLLASSIVSNVLPNANLIEPTATAINLFILLVASVFFASNNLPQKILLAISLYFNFTFVAGFVPDMLGVSPFEVSNFFHILVINFMYGLFCLIYAAIFWGPTHYFHRTFSLTTIGLCIIQLLACIVCEGIIPSALLEVAYSAPLGSSLFLYAIVIFCTRATYESAKHKASDIDSFAQDKIMDAWAESFNSMLSYVNTQKHLTQSFSYNTNRVSTLTKDGNYSEALKLSEQFQNELPNHPLLQSYCENPHINALIATKTTQAASKGIILKSSVSFKDSPVELVTLCSIVNLILNMAIEESKELSLDSKQISLNIQSTGNSLNIEGIFPALYIPKEKFDITKTTFKEILISLKKYLLIPKHELINSNLNNIIAITEKYKGNLKQTQTNEEFMIRINLNK